MFHECTHCLDYSMKQDRITQREAFDWNITPEMKGWGEKIRREYDGKKNGKMVLSKEYRIHVFDDEWIDDYEGKPYNDNGREHLTRRAQYLQDSMLGSGKHRKKDYSKGSPVVGELIKKLFLAGAREEPFYE